MTPKFKPFLFSRHYSNVKFLPFKRLSAPAYKPSLVEKDKYDSWKRSFCANNDGNDSRPVFSMVLPPPNVTGKLHLGVIQDVIVRREREKGKNVLWLPGTDHAGIATQGVVEKYLATKSLDKYKLGRAKFNEEIWKWKEKYGESICEQLRSLGLSLDWSRNVFTMDPKHAKSVERAFITLFDRGLIYRNKSLVNWCVALKSTISDIEVDNIEIDGPTDIRVPGYDKPVRFGEMIELEYKMADSRDSICVATTRLETMLGDVAIAVHPDDNRYKHLHGKSATHPIRQDVIPVITDSSVDMSFGTGAVKITPCHDKNDFGIGLRHDLPMIEVIDENGVINQGLGHFSGMKRYECRVALYEKLLDLRLIRKVLGHKMNLPMCSRSNDVVELLLKDQWFIKCKDMSRKACKAVENGDLKIIPENFEKNWTLWTKDERDWCISRQLWWGHQIPAYKCRITTAKDSIWIAASDENEARIKASQILKADLSEIMIERDTDVLDTWFSAGIYPFSSLGWPERTSDLNKFYPLSLMVTGHDILGFWVHRMVILGQELTGKLPFDKVLLHGIICDSKGAKMSKSKGNVLDPVDIVNGIPCKELVNKYSDMYQNGVISKIEYEKAVKYTKSNFSNGIPECGVDALRLTLLSKDIKSNFVHFDLDLCHTNKLFGNKLWQSVKYCQISSEKLSTGKTEVSSHDLMIFDKWILSRLANVAVTVNESLDAFDFHLAVKALKQFLYNDFCDFYLETTKLGIENDLKVGYAHLHTLSTVLNAGLRLLNPFMVYLSEELLDKLPNLENNIIHNFQQNQHFIDSSMFSKWKDVDLELKMNDFINLVSLVRQLKGFYSIPNRIKPELIIKNCHTDLKLILKNNSAIFNFITRTQGLDFVDEQINLNNVITGIFNETCSIQLVLPEELDSKTIISNVKEKLDKKISKTSDILSRLNDKIINKGYNEKTPENDKLNDFERLQSLKEELKNLKRLMSA